MKIIKKGHVQKITWTNNTQELVMEENNKYHTSFAKVTKILAKILVKKNTTDDLGKLISVIAHTDWS